MIFIFSLSGHRVVPNAAGHFYSVTKCAVSAILEGIRNELHMLNSHIRVSVRNWGFYLYTVELRVHPHVQRYIQIFLPFFMICKIHIHSMDSETKEMDLCLNSFCSTFEFLIRRISNSNLYISITCFII